MEGTMRGLSSSKLKRLMEIWKAQHVRRLLRSAFTSVRACRLASQDTTTLRNEMESNGRLLDLGLIPHTIPDRSGHLHCFPVSFSYASRYLLAVSLATSSGISTPSLPLSPDEVSQSRRYCCDAISKTRFICRSLILPCRNSPDSSLLHTCRPAKISSYQA